MTKLNEDEARRIADKGDAPRQPLRELVDILTEAGAVPVINGVRWTPPAPATPLSESDRKAQGESWVRANANDPLESTTPFPAAPPVSHTTLNAMRRVGFSYCVRCEFTTEGITDFDEQDKAMRAHLEDKHPGWLLDMAGQIGGGNQIPMEGVRISPADPPVEAQAQECGHTWSCMTCDACPECESCKHVDKNVWPPAAPVEVGAPVQHQHKGDDPEWCDYFEYEDSPAGQRKKVICGRPSSAHKPSVEVGVEGTLPIEDMTEAELDDELRKFGLDPEKVLRGGFNKVCAALRASNESLNAAQSKLTRLEKVLRELPWPAYTEGTMIAVCVVCKQLPHKYRDCPVFALESAKKLLERKS